ncbi:PAN domain protein [Oesophagostomum dentatum]|uniref:PAN domain protein n=1 Tax=Oesophagostomum dentatum TaxID=61180 RepID=A0A0B1SVQ8_OESDE|nr:PAN domain protein [Oesophagostomum dentatum]
MRTVTFLALLLVQMSPTKPCSFIRMTGEFLAAAKFSIGLGSEDLCLATCVDELDCAFVGYSERNCTVFTDGNNRLMMSNGSLLKLERDTPRPECPTRVKFGIPVKFQQIAVDKTDNTTCSGLPTATTVIFAFLDSNNYRFFGKEDENFFTGMSKGNILTFARHPQLHCASVPVFARAGRRRLFFGSVYNTTGYTFMDAYAFTSKCACESGACCGITEIREYTPGNKTYVYAMNSPFLLSDLDQSFFIASCWL